MLDPTIGEMYLDNWFAGVQHAVGKNMVVEGDYIGSRGNNMYVRYDVNRFNGDLLDGRFDGIIPGVSQLLYGQALDKSHYNGVTAAARLNRADLQFGAAYTLGKAIDYSSTATPPARPDANGPAVTGQGTVGCRHPSQARAVGQLDDSGAGGRRDGGRPGGLAACGNAAGAERLALLRGVQRPIVHTDSRPVGRDRRQQRLRLQRRWRRQRSTQCADVRRFALGSEQ